MNTRALAALLLLAVPAGAAPVEIAKGVHLLRGEYVPGRQPDGNSVLFETRRGLVVVDTGRHEPHTRELLAFAAARRKPLRAAVNTHWHLDHTGGNVLLRRELPGVRIYASAAIDAAMTGFLANYAKQLQEMIGRTEGEEQQRFRTELGLIESGRLGPDERITASGRRKIGGRRFDVHLEKNTVTAGDLWLVDEATGVLVAGDLVTLPFPFLDTACPAHWKEALGRLAGAGFEVLVPGHGAPMTREQFGQYRAAFDNLVDCGRSSRSNEECATGWLTDAAPFLEGSDQAFIRQALDYYVDGFLRPSSKVAHLCGQ